MRIDAPKLTVITKREALLVNQLDSLVILTRYSLMTSFTSIRMRIKADGSIETPGIDFGPMKLVALRGDTLAVKVEGSKYWSGIGQPQAYAPAKFMIFEILDRHDPDEGSLKVMELIQFPVRS